MAKGLLVEFFMDAVHLKAKSDREGRNIFEDREHVRIIPIGDNKTVNIREATDQDRQRFAEEYAVFKKGTEGAFVGTPLKQWPTMLPSQIKLLEHFNVYTVDQLAELDDIAINRIGPGTRDLVEKAKAFIAKAKSTADAQHFAVENERLRSEMAQMQQTIKDLAAKVEGAQDAEQPQKRGPGRPRKDEKAEEQQQAVA